MTGWALFFAVLSRGFWAFGSLLLVYALFRPEQEREATLIGFGLLLWSIVWAYCGGFVRGAQKEQEKNRGNH